MMETPKQERPGGKHKKKGKLDILDLSQINNDMSLSQKSCPRGSRVTSTPNIDGLKKANVKSIMKNTSTFINDTMDSINLDNSLSKSKKRNKSVSFMLEDNEQVAMKKSKSDTSAISKPKYKSPKKGQETQNARKDKTKPKKEKRNDAEKENQEAPESRKADIADQNNIDMGPLTKLGKPKVKKSNSILDTELASPDGDNAEPAAQKKKEKKKRYKKKKYVSNSESSEQTENNSNSNQDHAAETKEKKNKKKKRKFKPTDNTETNGEPTNKSPKKDIVPEVVAEDLEKLNIGYNPHTLTNLLDQMKVVDKKKKNKKSKKNKDKLKGENKNPATTNSATPTEKGDIVNDLEKIEEGKEKVIWKKRKWNKGRRAVSSTEETLLTSVIVDNLPLKIMLEYRKMLSEHFSKLGPVKSIGVAEVYPMEESKPVFTTTVAFNSEGAATEALSEDNTVLFGSRIRVRRPLPAAVTTLVVRSYGGMTEQALSSAFIAAGRIRSVRHSIKGKNSFATAFVEFDGPEAVERALIMAEDVKIGGKKIHASKFVQREKREETRSGQRV